MSNPARTLVMVWLSFALSAAWGQPSRLEWVQRFPTTSPPRRSEAASAYDSKRQVMVMFGGASGGPQVGNPFNDQVWEWNGESWFLARPPGRYGPEGRVSAAMAFDSERGVCVLFGGHYNDPQGNDQRKFGDTWEWNGQFWKLQTTNGPFRRAEHAMAYDADRKRTVLYGGSLSLGSYLPAETWEWDGETWLLAAVNGPPLRRMDHAMAYDAKRKVTILFGGAATLDGENVSYPTDTWAWDGKEWTRVATTGPSGLIKPTMVYDSQHEVVVMLGGYDTDRKIQKNLNEVWEWNGREWSAQTADGLGVRDTPAIVYDSSRKEIVLFGGYEYDLNQKQSRIYDDTWVLRLRETWVDFGYAGIETGGFATPFNTLLEGAGFAPSDTIIKIKAGSTSETLRLTKSVTIRAIGGSATIGRR